MINLNKALFRATRSYGKSIREIATKPKRNSRGDIASNVKPKSSSYVKSSIRLLIDKVPDILKVLLSFTAVGSIITLTLFYRNSEFILNRLRNEKLLGKNKPEINVVSLDEKYRNFEYDIKTATKIHNGVNRKLKTKEMLALVIVFILFIFFFLFIIQFLHYVVIYN